MEFYERVYSARMHNNYIRPGGVYLDLPEGLLSDIFQFCIDYKKALIGLVNFLDESRIWKERLFDVGKVFDKDWFNYIYLLYLKF